MKKLFSAALSLTLTLALAAPVSAAEVPSVPPLETPEPISNSLPAPWVPQGRTIIANGQAVDLLDLPVDFYKEGETTMVPLRRIAEALGLTVEWDPDTGAVTVEDSVQKATLWDGEQRVSFAGKLQIIDLSREVDCPAAVTVRQWHTYVPLSLFEEFFNDVSETEASVTVTPHMYQIDGAEAL